MQIMMMSMQIKYKQILVILPLCREFYNSSVNLPKNARHNKTRQRCFNKGRLQNIHLNL